MIKRKNIVSGLWKFDNSVSIKELTEIVENWVIEDPRYIQLYIRQVASNLYGIGFMYQLSSSAENHNVYKDQTSDVLKRRFGNLFVGCDISSPIWIYVH